MSFKSIVNGWMTEDSWCSQHTAIYISYVMQKSYVNIKDADQHIHSVRSAPFLFNA